MARLLDHRGLAVAA